MHNEILKIITDNLPNNVTEFWAFLTAIALILSPILGSAVFDFFDEKWYATLRKPSFAPSLSTYQNIWAILYIIMGYANYLAWEATPLGGGCLCSVNALKAYFTGAPGIFWLHMILNYGSTWVAFKARSLKGTFLATLALTAAAGFVTYRFYLVDQKAAMWMIPYMLMLTYDINLVYNIYVLNKPKKSAEILKKNK